ncbi:MAG TPA: polysaccharide lyase family 8 super-sandwich domain-containing protein [Chryseosolibacter sp.]
MLSLKFCTSAIVALLILPWSSGPLHRLQEVFSEPRRGAISVAAGNDLEIIRVRVIADLLEPPVEETAVRDILKAMKPDGSWPDINYQDVSRTGFQHSRHLARMLDLARAYKKSNSPFHGRQDVKKAVSAALDFWISHDFICDNWWWNEMGTPNWMINIMLVLDTDLTEKQKTEGLKIAGRANLEGFGARPGGDLIQIAGMLGKQALFRRDETILEKVVSVMANEIRITTGRGLQPDMSFHHRVDNVISTLSYGLGYATAFSYWAVKIRGTKFNFPESAVRLLIDYYLDGICKSMAFAKYPDAGARNRDLSRKGTLNPAGVELPENLLKTSDYRREELEQVVKIRKGEIEPELTWDRFFWDSEYFTHQRPGYFSSVRMHSARNHTVEEPHNEEGLKNHHLGDGSNFISVSGKEYLDIFPVWDWQKIPGTTVVQKPSLPHWKEIARKGLTDFVGGVSNGTYGAAAFDFKSAHDPLKARKAWFFFDDEFVCLGSGISAESGYPVYTTLNQCLLDQDVIVKTKKDEVVLGRGKHDLSNVSWVLHGGVGYLFPKPQTVSVSNVTASGTWREINHQSASLTGTVQLDVFTLWLDHGIKPAGAQYEYIVLPGKDKAAVDLYSKNMPLEILANTPELQAVAHRDLHRAEMVFYEQGKVRINDEISLSAASACMAMLKANGKSLEMLTVSDPSRKLNHLQFQTTAQAEGSGDGWRATWDKKEKSTVIDIDLPQGDYAGQSVILTFVNE